MPQLSTSSQLWPSVSVTRWLPVSSTATVDGVSETSSSSLMTLFLGTTSLAQTGSARWKKRPSRWARLPTLQWSPIWPTSCSVRLAEEPLHLATTWRLETSSEVVTMESRPTTAWGPSAGSHQYPQCIIHRPRSTPRTGQTWRQSIPTSIKLMPSVAVLLSSPPTMTASSVLPSPASSQPSSKDWCEETGSSLPILPKELWSSKDWSWVRCLRFSLVRSATSSATTLMSKKFHRKPCSQVLFNSIHILQMIVFQTWYLLFVIRSPSFYELCKCRGAWLWRNCYRHYWISAWWVNALLNNPPFPRILSQNFLTWYCLSYLQLDSWQSLLLYN